MLPLVDSRLIVSDGKHDTKSTSYTPLETDRPTGRDPPTHTRRRLKQPFLLRETFSDSNIDQHPFPFSSIIKNVFSKTSPPPCVRLLPPGFFSSWGFVGVYIYTLRRFWVWSACDLTLTCRCCRDPPRFTAAFMWSTREIAPALGERQTATTPVTRCLTHGWTSAGRRGLAEARFYLAPPPPPPYYM